VLQLIVELGNGSCIFLKKEYNKFEYRKMALNNIIPWVQIFISAALTASVLLQQRGSSLGGAFGGGGASYHTKRGFEKILFNSTIIFGILFGLTAIASLVL